MKHPVYWDMLFPLGPSYTLDSTWVGGVECLKHAVHDIKIGRIESALVGVSSVILYPDLSLHWMGLEKLSPDGTCNPFQEDGKRKFASKPSIEERKIFHINKCLVYCIANGYGRSEGVVFLYLQRANDANRIYATVSHVDTTFCGEKSKTFLKPKEEAFVEFFRKFYTDYPISFDDIAYLEADGCAHKVSANFIHSYYLCAFLFFILSNLLKLAHYDFSIMMK